MRVTTVTTSEGPKFSAYPNATDDDDDVTGAEDDSDSVLLKVPTVEGSAATTTEPPQSSDHPGATEDDAAAGSEDDSVPLPKRVLLLDTQYEGLSEKDRRRRKRLSEKDAPTAEQRRKVLSMLDTGEESGAETGE